MTPDSPAQRAGLEQGDIIVGYQGQEVENVGEFRNRVSLTDPGSRERLTVIRDGRRLNLTIEIGELQAVQEITRGKRALAGPGSDRWGQRTIVERR